MPNRMTGAQLSEPVEGRPADEHGHAAAAPRQTMFCGVRRFRIAYCLYPGT